MQHMGLQRQSETGEVLAHFGDEGIDPRIVSLAAPSTACLRFIDPYGNTIFNQLQLPVLAGELLTMRETSADEGLRSQLDRVLAFLRESEGTHVYVRFIGD